MTVKPCPPDEVLHRMLEGTLDPEGGQKLDRHLRTCGLCVRRLERLTEDPDLRLEILHSPGRDVPTPIHTQDIPGFWSHLAQLTAAPLRMREGLPEQPELPRELPRIPGYLLLRVLGRGGSGLVYEAQDLRLRRRVAIKMLGDRHLQADSLERLRREAEAIARLRHPHIVQIHRIDTWEERTFLELEYVAGGSLAGRLTGRPHGPQESARFVSRLARAMHFGHQEQVIHRDLKPSNILLDSTPLAAHLPAGEIPLDLFAPKITDFGLAKLLDSDQERTRHGQLLGTPAYASPEQLEGTGEQVGPTTDVYSLGAILYELLTGRAPFRGEDLWQTVQQVRHSEPVAPRLLNPLVPQDLETICLKCLEKSPRSRYATAADLAEDLDRFLDHRSIVARPLGWGERVARWARRNRQVAGLLAMIALLVATVVLGSLGSARHYYLMEQQERRLQEELSAHQDDLRRTNREKSLALADSYRTLGLGAGQVGRPHLAALYFAHAADETRNLSDGGRDEGNAIRTRHWLDRCPLPTAFLEHPDQVRLDDVVFHPSSRWLLCQPYARSDAQFVYDLETGRRIDWPAAWGRVTAAAWNTAGDRIFAGTAAGQLVEASFPEFATLWDHPIGAPVRGVAVSALGDTWSAATDDRLWIWSRELRQGSSEPRDVTRLVTEVDNLTAPVIDLLFDPSGRWCLALTEDRWLTARQSATGATGIQVQFGLHHFDWSRIRPQFDVDGSLLVWSDFELSRVDLDRTEQIPLGRADGGYSFEVSPHDGTILVGTNFRALLRTANGERRVNGTTTYSVCWLADGTALLGATEGDMLQRLDVHNGTMTPWPLFQSDGTIRIRLSPDEKRLATISNQGQLRVWRMPREVGEGLVRARIPTVMESDWGQVSPHSTALDHNSLLLVRRFGVNAQLHRIADGSPAGPPLVPDGRLQDARWMADGERVLTLATRADEQGAPLTLFDLWQGRTGERCQPTIQVPLHPRNCEESPHQLLAVSPRGDRVAVVEHDLAGLSLISLQTGTPAVQRVPIAAEWLANLPQWNSLVVVEAVGVDTPSQLSAVLLVDWDTGEITRRFPVPNALGVLVSPDGNQIAVGTRQSEVWLLDPTGMRSEPIRLSHPNWAFADGYSRDSRRLVTRGKDRFFRIWDVPRQSVSAPLAEFVFHAHSTFAAQDTVLVACNMRGNLELLSAFDGQPLAPALSLGHRPIMPEEGGYRFSETADGNNVVIGGAPFLTILDLTDFRQEHPLAGQDLIDWCMLVSGHRLVQGQASPLSGDEWSVLWRRFAARRAQHPDIHPN